MKKLALAIVFAACSVEAPPPPLICRAPATATPWFTDVTAEMQVTALATAVRAADLDGDGYPDVIASVAHLARRNMPDRFLLMNRADAMGNRILVDTTAESGLLATTDGAGGRAWSNTSVGDLDGDGDLDVVACPASMDAPDPCAAFINDGSAHFTLAGELEGGAFACHSTALLDFDRDGNLDLWPGNYDERPRLYRGNGDGTFAEVGAQMGLPQLSGDYETHQSFRRSFGVTACDLDGDGDLDVLLADYGREANQVWRNDGSTFVEIGQSLGLAFDDRMDYSDDLSYRCYCNDFPGECPSTIPKPPAGYCPGRGWVPGESDQPWRLGGNSFSFACGDLDDDGDMDVMTAEIRHGDVGSASDPSEIAWNEGARFTRPGIMASGLYRAERGVSWNQGDMMPVFSDIDLDGRKDIYLSSSDYPGNHGWIFRNRGDGTFEDVTAASGGGAAQIHGVALVDLDLDGDLDLLAGTSTARGVAPTNALRVYRNQIVGNFIRITLDGKGKNRAAIGARVRVTAGGRTQTQEVSGGYGHGSMQHDLALTFGLGDACVVDAIEVRWPDGQNTVEKIQNVRANYRVSIKQGERRVRYVR